MGESGLYHYSDSGYKVDLSKQQEQLAEKAYIDGFDPENHDEYLVNGAILTCSKAVTDVKVLHGRVYNVKKPSKETVLTVTENPQAKCCGYLYHATVEDRKVEINISPFRCNCSREPHNDKEWDKLEADESCMEEGTCKALINLHDQWDNLPAENPYLLFWNEDRRGMVQGITMSSMLFCRHGGIITPVESGQTLQMAGLITIDQLKLLGWNNITQDSIDELNRVLNKYGINSVERIRHFLAQCMKETERGSCLKEGGYINWSSQADYEKYYNDKTAYGYKYRGAGYLQLTWDYGYLAFATYMIQQECTDLGIEWRAPRNTGTGFQERYDAAVQKAEEAGYNVDNYKKIVTEGADYVADEFAWESAGYDWNAKDGNSIVDGLTPDDPNSVDKITEVINRYTPSSSYEDRRDNYEELMKVIQ